MNNKDLLTLLKNICKENDLELESYSGRYMYGSKCYGVVVDSEHQFKEMITDYNDGSLTGKEIKSLLNYSIDNMGNDKIIYYPNLVYEEVKEYDSSEEDDEEFESMKKEQELYAILSGNDSFNDDKLPEQ